MSHEKIIFCSVSYKPSVGGIERYIESYAGFLCSEGKQVQVFTADADACRQSEEMLDGVRVHRAEGFKFQSWFRLLALFSPFIVIKRIQRQIETYRSEFDEADVIVARHIYYAAALVHFPDLEKKSVFIAPLVAAKLTSINARSGKWLSRGLGYWHSLQLRLIESQTMTRFKNLAVLSESKKKELESRFSRRRRKIKVIPPGVDLERFRPVLDSRERTNILSGLGRECDVDLDVILSVARLTEEKNISELIKACVQRKDGVLYIIGDGPLRPRLEKDAKENSVNCIFFGQRDDVEVFYRVASVFVLPSKYEGFGHVFLEAMASGCPVVGVHSSPPDVITASDELIVEGVNGSLSIRASAKEIDLAIDRVLAGICKNGVGEKTKIANFARTHYAWANCHSKIRALLNEQ